MQLGETILSHQCARFIFSTLMISFGLQQRLLFYPNLIEAFYHLQVHLNPPVCEYCHKALPLVLTNIFLIGVASLC